MANKCKFRKKNGSRCGANAQPANGLCVFHDPARASEGRRARQAGGINRSRLAVVLPTDTPDHPLGNTTDVSELLADSINQLRRGQLDPRVANAMGYLASVLLKALDQRLEERLAHLEAVISGKGENESEMTKLMRTFASLVESLSRYRGKGEQKMIIEHVHVHRGGQAIVGPVTQNNSGNRGGGDEKE